LALVRFASNFQVRSGLSQGSARRFFFQSKFIFVVAKQPF